jgi:cystathionine beta-lyase/cystathionine gamma-synthase
LEALGEKVAMLEGLEAALPTSSGMAAMAMTLLSLAESGDHLVASKHLYGHTYALLDSELPRRGISTTFVDPFEEGAWERALRPATRAFVFEVPTNPTLRVIDPRPVVSLAREVGVRVVVDGTFASPANLRLGELGVDVVIHSATKYLGGHSDLIAGVASGCEDLIRSVRETLKLYGPALDPHGAWLLDRGIRTLAVRMDRHNANGIGLATWLESRPEVSEVSYPGLPSHPDFLVAGELLAGYGGMVSMVLEGGGVVADSFCGALRLARVAPSLGGVETLVCQPRYTSHRGLTPEEREAIGIPDGFVRVSVGIEDLDDLISDFQRALEQSATEARR